MLATSIFYEAWYYWQPQFSNYASIASLHLKINESLHCTREGNLTFIWEKHYFIYVLDVMYGLSFLFLLRCFLEAESLGFTLEAGQVLKCAVICHGFSKFWKLLLLISLSRSIFSELLQDSLCWKRFEYYVMLTCYRWFLLVKQFTYKCLRLELRDLKGHVHL